MRRLSLAAPVIVFARFMSGKGVLSIINQVMRKEKKFLLSRWEFYALKHRLNEVLHGDPHNGPEGYRVRSLYFDSIDDRDYFEKLYGLETRRKLRLRCYDPAGDFAMLEMKQKQGDTQKKRSMRLSREDAQRLCRGDFTPLLRCGGEQKDFALECYGMASRLCYRPCTIVEYQRMAYIGKENRIRITMDHNVVATESCMDLFSAGLAMNPVLDPSLVVLEVKYNNFLLSYFQQLLNAADRPELSVSKYYLARQNAYRTHL